MWHKSCHQAVEHGGTLLSAEKPVQRTPFWILGKLLCGNFHQPVHLYSCFRTLFATLLRLHSYSFGRNTFLANHFCEAFGGAPFVGRAYLRGACVPHAF